VIVLDEVEVNPALGVALALPRLEEEAPVVSMQIGLDQDQVVAAVLRLTR